MKMCSDLWGTLLSFYLEASYTQVLFLIFKKSGKVVIFSTVMVTCICLVSGFHTLINLAYKDIVEINNFKELWTKDLNGFW